ncbi:hypothetical protein C8R47DRAFT_597394 [Mycena vitilis]|nr:hypothetical protein C8R47DRAFT_597394 [Mycena vitilis]
MRSSYVSVHKLGIDDAARLCLRLFRVGGYGILYGVFLVNMKTAIDRTLAAALVTPAHVRRPAQGRPIHDTRRPTRNWEPCHTAVMFRCGRAAVPDNEPFNYLRKFLFKCWFTNAFPRTHELRTSPPSCSSKSYWYRFDHPPTAAGVQLTTSIHRWAALYLLAISI